MTVDAFRARHAPPKDPARTPGSGEAVSLDGAGLRRLQLPKHTNLTVGGRAYLGGELWFSDRSSLFLSGGSGRYPPIDAEQLDDATQDFEYYGYRVNSLGWDDDTARAERVLKG